MCDFDIESDDWSLLVRSEARSLITLKKRQSRVVYPLREYFVEDLFAPATQSLVFKWRDEWQQDVASIKRLISDTIDTYWSDMDWVERMAYDRHSGAVEPLSDYPPWAHRATKNILFNATSIFQHGGTGANGGRMLFLARSWSGEGDRITDAQLLASLALAVAITAAWILIRAIQNVHEEDAVNWWLHVAQKREHRTASMQEALKPDISAAVDKAALRYYFSEIPYVTQQRIHAEQLLFLAQLRASGSIDADQVELMASKISEAENERFEVEKKLAAEEDLRYSAERAFAEVRAKSIKGVTKGAAARRKLSPPQEDAARARAKAMRENGKLEKEIELDLAADYEISRSTIQRVLGKKK